MCFQVQLSDVTVDNDTDGGSDTITCKAAKNFSRRYLGDSIATNGDGGDKDDVVMSPKTLTVETKSPYDKVITTINGGKSTMV